MSDGDPRKLIEVKLPLQEISKASVADKNRSVGTIKNLHKWFAPMPTPALRALIFATLVNDPGNEADRDELTKVLKGLLPEDGKPPADDVLDEARKLIARDNPELPIVLDPFCGGGSTVVEAQRLGLPTIASDLNPVAVLITQVLGELLPPMARASGMSAAMSGQQVSLGLQATPFEGFIADLRYYGGLVQDAVRKQLDDLYPEIATGEPVAWLWSRTAPCPNPMCCAIVPLFSSPVLSKQPGREASVEAIVDGGTVRFIIHNVKDGRGRSVKVAGTRARFECLACGSPFSEKELRKAGHEGKLGLQLMAVCVDLPGGYGRTFLSPEDVPAPANLPVIPPDLDEIEIGKNTRDFRTRLYGFGRHIDLYTPRQLAVLAKFADEVALVADRVREDGGNDQQAAAIASVLGLCVGKMAQGNSALVRWRTRVGPSKTEPAFGTQSIPMLWDFAEAYPFGKSRGSWDSQLDSVTGALRALPPDARPARVLQRDAREAHRLVTANAALLATDPPYFAQINYADLSDYFYLWLRRAMRKEHPDLFSTLAAPKEGELTANPERFGGSRAKAREYFITGFTEVFSSLKAASRPDLPLVVAYAHKQDEHVSDGVSSTGWAALLEAMLAANLGIVRTWPIQATSTTRQVSQGANALATYVIMICRPRPPDLPATDRQGFLAALDGKLPAAINDLGHMSAADLAQAAIGPGMQVFSGFGQVLEDDGRPMSIPVALALSNAKLQSILWGHEAEFDQETRAAIAWYDEFGWADGDSGRAEQIAFGKDTTIRRLVQAGIWRSHAGVTRLVPVDEIWNLSRGKPELRSTTWRLTMLLCWQAENRGIEHAVRSMADAIPHVRIDTVKDLAHLLYTLARNRNRGDDQRRFNALVTAWRDILSELRELPADSAAAQPLLDEMGTVS